MKLVEDSSPLGAVTQIEPKQKTKRNRKRKDKSDNEDWDEKAAEFARMDECPH